MKATRLSLLLFVAFILATLFCFTKKATPTYAISTLHNNLYDNHWENNPVPTLFAKADSLKNSGYFLASAKCYSDLLGTSLSEENYFYTLNQVALSYLLAHKEQLAVPFLQQIETRFLTKLPHNIADITDYNFNKGLYHSRLYEPILALEYLQKAKNSYTELYGAEHLKVGLCLTHIGLMHYVFTPVVDSAFVYIPSAYSIFQHNENLKPYSAEAELAMAWLSISKRSIEVSLNHQILAYQCLKNKQNRDSVLWMKILILSKLCKNTKHELSEGLSESSIANLLPKEHTLLQHYMQVELFSHCDEAENIYKARVKAAISKFGTQRTVFADEDFLLGHYYFGKDNYAKAAKCYEPIWYYNDKKQPQVRLITQEAEFVLSSCYMKLKRFDDALKLQLSRIQDGYNLDQYLSLSAAKKDIYYGINCSYIGNILYEKYKTTHRTEDALLACKAFLTTDENLFSGLKATDDDAILRYQKEVGALTFLNAIEICDMLYKQTQHRKYLDYAFRFSDRMKSFLLFRSLQDKDSQNPVLLNIQQTEADIADLKVRMADVESRNLTGVSNILASKQIQLSTQYKTLENSYPDLFNARMHQYIPSVWEIQKSLAPDEAILQYAMASNRLSLVYVDKDTVVLYRCDTLTALQNNIVVMNHLLAVPDYQKQAFQTFKNVSFRLYDSLLKPVEALLQQRKNITIIPDQGLAQLPFEVLTTKENDTKELPYKDLDYCIRHYEIGYSPSWKIYATEKNTIIAANASLGTFSYGTTQKNGVLYCAENEINQIKTTFGSNHISINRGQNCSKAQFIDHHNSFDIVHLSLHASSDAVNKLDNKIYFQLPISDAMCGYELLRYGLKNKMVVLSACETNTGAIKAGEGSYSLSRYFLQAGVAYVVSSLWKVNDCTNSDIMVQFYNNIHNNKQPKQALHEAKLNFLNHADNITATPSFWAGMVFME